jgi:predicted Holliday junction resolvase-like endonuclease
MKKRILFLTILISILAINIFHFVSAQIPVIDNAAKQAEDLQKKLSSEETRNAFLKEKLLEYMQSTDTGKSLLSLNEKMSFFNPIFNLLLGINYSFSSLFFLTFLAWIVIITYIYRSLMVLNVKWMEHPKFVFMLKFVITTFAGIILSQIGLTKGIAFLLITPFYLFLTIIGIFIFILINSGLIAIIRPKRILSNSLTFFGSAFLTLILTAGISNWAWLKSSVEWLTTLPNWMNGLIIIILVVFILYYSMAYSKMLKVRFKKQIAQKQTEILKQKVERLEKKKKDEKEEALSTQEEEDLKNAKELLIELGKQLREETLEDGAGI